MAFTWADLIFVFTLVRDVYGLTISHLLKLIKVSHSVVWSATDIFLADLIDSLKASTAIIALMEYVKNKNCLHSLNFEIEKTLTLSSREAQQALQDRVIEFSLQLENGNSGWKHPLCLSRRLSYGLILQTVRDMSAHISELVPTNDEIKNSFLLEKEELVRVKLMKIICKHFGCVSLPELHTTINKWMRNLYE